MHYLNLNAELEAFGWKRKTHQNGTQMLTITSSYKTQYVIQPTLPGSDPAFVSMITEAGLPSVPFWESLNRAESSPCSRMAFLAKHKQTHK